MSELGYKPKKVRVLVVDDHELMRKSIAKILRKMDIEEIYDCSNGKDALRILKSLPIDLVFCDLYMPKFDGFELLKNTRDMDRNADIPFVIVTGEAGKDDIVKVVEMGAEDYLLKPFQADELEKKAHNMLKKYFNPEPVLLHARQAEKLLIGKHLDRALIEVEKAISIDPTSAKARQVKAMILSAKGEEGEAIKLLQRTIEDSPSYLKSYTTLTDAYLRVDNTAAAIDFLRSELDINPKNSLRQKKLAKLLLATGEFKGCIEHSRLALLENSKDKSGLMLMGRAYAQLKNLEKAVYYFKRLRRVTPTNSRPLEAIVKCALDANKPKVAEFALRDEKKSHPKRLDTYIILAKFYMATDEEAKALENLDMCLKVDPKFPLALQFKGNVELSMNKISEAMQTFHSLTKSAPSPGAYLKYAECLILNGDHENAIKVLNLCWRSQEHRSKVLEMVAYATLKSKQYTKSFFIYQLMSKRGLGNSQVDATLEDARGVITRRRKMKRSVRAS